VFPLERIAPFLAALPAPRERTSQVT
jgi:hypothetical protein